MEIQMWEERDHEIRRMDEEVRRTSEELDRKIMLVKGRKSQEKTSHVPTYNPISYRYPPVVGTRQLVHKYNTILSA